MGALVAMIAAVLAASPGPAAAERSALPVRQRTLLLLRVLFYDRNLPARAPGEVTVGVLFRAGDRASERERDEVIDALGRLGREAVAHGRAIRSAAVAFTGAADLDARVAALRPAALWICRGLAAERAEITRVTAARKVLSAAGSRAAVRAGIAVAIVPGPDRAVIVVNAAAAKGEGADLDAALLGVAEVIQGGR